MRRRWLTVGLLMLLGVGAAAGWLSYRSFHNPQATVSPSPTNPRWAADFLVSGFVDLDLDFRVIDLAASPFEPRYICDLYWEGRHRPAELRWSKDGSVIAITEIFRGHPGEFYGCAYDFSTHRILRTGARGFPLEPSAEFTSAVRKLLDLHGGVGQVAAAPDPTKP